jgi:hypothetical protein
VESVEFRIQDFKGDTQKGLGELQIRITTLKVTPGSVWMEDGFKGPSSWKPPQGKPYQELVWKLAADDAGHSVVLGGLSYSGNGSGGSGMDWLHASPPTKISCVRPLDAEMEEFPVHIDGIVVGSD